jgi:hypothetical protein
MQVKGSTSIPVLRGASVAPIGFGFFSLVVFWWYPFSLILSAVGMAIGGFCLLRKVRGIHGENFALIGFAICAINFSIIVTLTQVLHVAIWDR